MLVVVVKRVLAPKLNDLPDPLVERDVWERKWMQFHGTWTVPQKASKQRVCARNSRPTGCPSAVEV